MNLPMVTKPISFDTKFSWFFITVKAIVTNWISRFIFHKCHKEPDRHFAKYKKILNGYFNTGSFDNHIAIGTPLIANNTITLHNGASRPVTIAVSITLPAHNLTKSVQHMWIRTTG